MPESSLAEKKQKALAVSVDRINAAYRDGEITARKKNEYLALKAEAELEKVIGDRGYLGAIWERSIKHVIDGWNNLKESALRTPAGKVVGEVEGASLRGVTVPTSAADVKNELYYLGLAMWGEIQILTSVMNAVGEVTGKVVEKEALRWGAPPGLAQTIGIATDIGTGFALPVGQASKSFAKGVQNIAVGRGGRVAAREAAAQAGKEKAADAVKQATQVMAEGLRKDGAPEAAERLLLQADVRRVASTAEPLGKEAAERIGASGKAGAQVQGAAAIDDEGAKIIQKYEEKLAQETPRPFQELYAEKLKQAQDELKAVTEPQSHAIVEKLAEKLGYTMDDVRNIVPHEPLNEVQMFAFLKTIEPHIDEARRLGAIALQESTEANVINFLRHQMDFFEFAPKVRSAGVTGGRTVEIQKESPAVKAITDALLKYDTEKAARGDLVGSGLTYIEDFMEVSAKKDTAVEAALQAKSLWQRFATDAWPMIRTGYMNLLLARPVTQIRNLAGNSIASAMAVAERIAGGVFSADPKRGLVAGEGWALSKGMMLAMADGISAFKSAYSRLTPEQVSKLDVVPVRLPGALGRIMQAPGDTLVGMDNFFKTLLTRGSYYAQALREGSQKGLTKDDLANFVARRVDNPTERMIQEATEFATTQTFQNDLGTLGKAAQRFGQAGPMVLWFPFMKTPINLVKYAWRRTPGLQMISKSLYSDILEGGVKADMAIGRLTISNLLGMALFEMAKDGLITGRGPVDPDLRRVWLLTHEPYSIRGPNGWIPIADYDPGSTIVGMVGDFAGVMNQLDEPTAGQTGMAITFGIMNNIADQSWWATVGDLVDLSSGLQRGHTPGTSFSRVAFGPLITAATGGPLGASIARTVDPVRREIRTVMDDAYSRVAGWTDKVPAKRDSFGDKVLYPESVGSKWFGIVNPVIITPYKTDRIRKEAERLEARVPRFPWTVGGRGAERDEFDIRSPFPEDMLPVTLSGPQQSRWKEIYQQVLHDKEVGIEKTLLDDPDYNNPKLFTPALQRKHFHGYLGWARKHALDRLMIEDADLGVKVMTNKANALLPLIPLAERAAAETEIRGAISLFGNLSSEERANLLKWGTYEDATDDEETPEEQP